ncbi:MAG TPA: hypothetical protein VGJ43_14975 [Acidimicrobiales bacterium]
MNRPPTSGVPWPSFRDGVEATLPAVYRYLADTTGDAELAERVTAATFEPVAEAFAAGDPDCLQLGVLLAASRDRLADRLRSPAAGDPPVAAATVARVVTALHAREGLPPAEVARILGKPEPEIEALLAGPAPGSAGPDPPVADPAVVAALVARLAPARATARPARGAGARKRPVAPTRVMPAPAARPAAPVRREPVGRGRVEVSAGGGARPGPMGPVGPALGASYSSDRVSTRRGGRGEDSRSRGRRVAGLVAVGAVLVAALAVVVTAGDGGGGSTASGRGGAGAGDTGGGRTGGQGNGDLTGTPGTTVPSPPPTVLAPVTLGDTRPADGRAIVLTSVHVGPGGPYMQGPFAVAFGAEGLWATAIDDAGVWRAVRLDPTSGAILAEVPIPGPVPSARHHHGIALAGGYAWVPIVHEGLLRIDAITGTAAGEIDFGRGVDGTALTAGDGSVWAVSDDGRLRRLDAATGNVVASRQLPEVGRIAGGVDLAYGDGTLWISVAAEDGRHLSSFDPITLARHSHALVPTVGLPADAFDLAAVGGRVLITDQEPGGTTVVDPQDGLVSQYALGAAIAAAGSLAWVTDDRAGLATALDAGTGDLVAALSIPAGIDELVAVGDSRFWGAAHLKGQLVELQLRA